MAPSKFRDIDPGRVLAAIAGEIDADSLTETEHRLFEALLDAYLAGPTLESRALVTKMKTEGGYIGVDDDGMLIRTLPNGRRQILDPTPEEPKSAENFSASGSSHVHAQNSDITIIGGKGYAPEQITQITSILSADASLWYIEAHRNGNELLIFRGPHP